MKMRIIFVSVALLAVAGSVAYFLARPAGRRPRLDDAAARPIVEETRAGLIVQRTARQNAVDELAASLPDWSRFRGMNGTGVSHDKRIPTTWSDTENLAWRTALPGAGASSPVLTNDYAFVTSYSGYGEPGIAGNPNELKRHLTSIDRKSGNILWTQTIASEHPEDPYQGMGLPEHGYATNSPATDGSQVFAFLGKSGVVAFDLQGKELWRTSVGTESGNRGWGTAASLLLYEDLVIVNASEESQAIVALEKATGKEFWRAEASALELCYSTPAIVAVDETRDDLVLAVPGEIWGMNPRTGKLTWFVQTSLTDNLSPSVLVDGTTVYAFGGYRSSGSLAVRVGGTGNVTDSNILWTSRNSSYVATPVLVDRRLHWINDRGMYYCTNADTGELIRRDRVPQIDTRGHPVYASPIAVDGKLFVQTRNSGLLVIEPGEELNVLSQNIFDSDSSVFNATPAVDAGQLFLRSDKFLYCVSAD